jgi:hypothetical protein
MTEAEGALSLAKFAHPTAIGLDNPKWRSTTGLAGWRGASRLGSVLVMKIVFAFAIPGYPFAG